MSLQRDALLGVAIGDALGVPVEFRSREDIAKDPVVGMREFGVHNQPMGTWSDDSSLTFCLAEVLTREYNTEHIGKSFEEWLYDKHWTAHGKVFDIGGTTRTAIDRIAQGHIAETAGPDDDRSQGNGSLMRILPLVFHIKDMSLEDRWDIVKRTSAITHGHINCAIACFFYLEVAKEIIESKENIKHKHGRFMHAYHIACLGIKSLSLDHEPFRRIIDGDLLSEDVSRIRSTGYVVDTLEASLWCINNTNSYADAVLKAVNLGEDTDTTAAVTGGLAGILYGIDSAPVEWVRCLARRWDIEDLAELLMIKYP